MHLEFEEINWYSTKIRKLGKDKPTYDTKFNLAFEITGFIEISRCQNVKFTMSECQHGRHWRHLVMSLESYVSCTSVSHDTDMTLHYTSLLS
jgi:hypothetical protein